MSMISDMLNRIDLLEKRMENFENMVLSFFSLVKMSYSDEMYDEFVEEFPETAKKLGWRKIN